MNAAGHHVTIKPFRLKERDDRLVVDKLRGVGYRAVCSCGWRGGVKGQHRDARAEWKAHESGQLSM